MAIKTLIFDLGGVIVPFDFKRAYARMEPLCRYTAAEIPKRIGASDLVRRFETGRIAPEQFAEEVCAILELNTTFDEFRGVLNCIFFPETLIPESFLAGLRGRYRLLLLSNTNAIHFPMIQANYPLLRHMDHCVLSYEVGATKPSTRIYLEAIARAECRPEECFFTDDVPAYVEAARQHGIDAVQFQSLAQLEEELRARGVL